MELQFGTVNQEIKSFSVIYRHTKHTITCSDVDVSACDGQRIVLGSVEQSQLEVVRLLGSECLLLYKVVEF